MTEPAADRAATVDEELERTAAAFFEPDAMYPIVQDPEADPRDLWTAARVWHSSREAELVPWIITHPAADQDLIDEVVAPDLLAGLPADQLVPVAMCPVQMPDQARAVFATHPDLDVRAAFEQYQPARDRLRP